MENKGTGGKVAILGAIITAIAGIITTIVTISAPLIDKNMAIQATQTREAFLTGATRVAGAANQRGITPTLAVPSTVGVEPSQTALPAGGTMPIVTILPAGNDAAGNAAAVGLPSASATPAGTLLRVGDTKTSSNGISVQLTQIEFPAPNEIHLHFTFTNSSSKVMKLVLEHNRDVSLTDDQGNVYNWASTFTWEVSIYPGTSRNDEVKRRGDVSRASYFIVKLDMPGIISAQWRN